MNKRISELKEYIISGKHHALRADKMFDASSFRTGSLPQRTAQRLSAMLEAQDIVFIPGERFIPTRTTKDAPDILSEEEFAEIKKSSYIHEKGYVCNICPDYSFVIKNGLDAVREKIASEKSKYDAVSEKYDWLCAAEKEVQAVLDFAQRYRDAARERGFYEIADTLENIPRKGAKTFREALQFFRILHFALWCEGEYHVIIGRFDKFMFPYLEEDMREGRLDEETAFELLLDFFLSFNKDSDLYPGMQQGDNGQSIMLGGLESDGTDSYNFLSGLCLKASLELKVIDPKINLRVSRTTPAERFEFASKLTATGIGFPQYANDDVVIPGLMKLGYGREDAYNYVVAACWEFIIPGCGMDIPNIDALPYLTVIDRTIREELAGCGNFELFIDACCKNIIKTAKSLPLKHRNIFIRPAPFMSLFFEGCLLNASDISSGCKYNNYGIHGTGLASAADAAETVKKLVFEEGMKAPDLIKMLDCNYEGYESIRAHIKRDIPKMGNDEAEPDEIACRFLEAFAKGLCGEKNERGGIYRAGTGTAMYYVSHAAKTGATADGRKKGDFLPANYSPSLDIKLKGPFSIIKSFTKPDIKSAVNGGPLTLEFTSASACSEEGIKKLQCL